MKNFLIILFAFLLLSCDDDNGSQAELDYLIFGHFYGECIGEECVETFKLTNNALYEDRIDNYFADDSFEFDRLAHEKYLAVKELMDEIPNELLLLPDSTFGCPDCRDQGGIYLQISRYGEISKWRIDNDKTNIPDFLYALVDMVHEKITAINK